MIKHIISTSPWLTSNNSSGSNLPYISGSDDPMRGVIRLMNGQMESWSGAGCLSINSGSAYIDLSDQAKSVLVWAEKKMREEATALALAEKHPAVADALREVGQAEEKLKVVLALTQENK